MGTPHHGKALPAILSQGAASALRLIPQDGHHMVPTLNRGDYIIAVLVDHFVVDGLYALNLFGAVVIYRCQSLGLLGVKVSSDDSMFEPTVMSHEEFNDCVLAKSVGEVRISEPVLLEQAMAVAA